MTEGKRKYNRFALGILLYASVVILAMIIGLRLLTDWIQRYENALPKNVINDYISSFSDEDIARVSESFISGLNKNLETDEESIEAVKALFHGEMTCAKNVADSTKTSLVYVVQVDRKKLGEITLSTEDDVSGKYRAVHWDIVSESYDFSELTKSAEIKVPDSWSVSFNGHTLGDEYITESGLQFEELAKYYNDYEGLPVLQVYAVSGYVGDYDFVVTDEAGNTVDMSGEPDYSSVLDNCTEAEKSLIDEFCKVFAEKRVQFLSNTGAGFYSNCAELQALIVPGTSLYNDLPLAKDSLYYVRGHFETVEQVDVTKYYKLDGSSWLVDMTYIVRVKGDGDSYKRSSNDITLIVVSDSAKGLLAKTLTTYPSVLLEG